MTDFQPRSPAQARACSQVSALSSVFPGAQRPGAAKDIAGVTCWTWRPFAGSYGRRCLRIVTAVFVVVVVTVRNTCQVPVWKATPGMGGGRERPGVGGAVRGPETVARSESHPAACFMAAGRKLASVVCLAAGPSSTLSAWAHRCGCGMESSLPGMARAALSGRAPTAPGREALSMAHSMVVAPPSRRRCLPLTSSLGTRRRNAASYRPRLMRPGPPCNRIQSQD